MRKELRFAESSFVKSAVKPKDYPDPTYPEVAVVGRSNVGKSSLMNSLCNRKGLVQVSRTPGRTRLINFFMVDNSLSFVDLPGYGYAKVPKAMKNQWRPMIENYLNDRTSLVGCVMLFDIRRDPTAEDVAMWDWFHFFDLNVVPVLTKCDKFSSQKAKNRAFKISKALNVPIEAMILTSAKSHKGRDQLRRVISGFCWDFKAPEEKLPEENIPEENTPEEKAFSSTDN